MQKCTALIFIAMNHNIRQIFEHSRQVVIDAIKTFVKAQPNEIYDLKECPPYYQFSDYYAAQTFKIKSLLIRDDVLYVKILWGYGIDPDDSCMKEEYNDIDMLSMDEIYNIIKGM